MIDREAVIREIMDQINRELGNTYEARHAFTSACDEKSPRADAPRPAGARYGVVYETDHCTPHMTDYFPTEKAARDFIRDAVRLLPDFSAGKHAMVYSLTANRPYMRAQVEKFGLISYSVVEL